MPCSSNLENITLKIGSLNLELWWEPASPGESSVPTLRCFGPTPFYVDAGISNQVSKYSYPLKYFSRMFLIFNFFLNTRFHYVAQTGLELTMYL